MHKMSYIFLKYFLFVSGGYLLTSLLLFPILPSSPRSFGKFLWVFYTVRWGGKEGGTKFGHIRAGLKEEGT